MKSLALLQLLAEVFFNFFFYSWYLLNVHLFVKVPPPGDNEFSFFESSYHLLLTTSLITQK